MSVARELYQLRNNITVDGTRDELYVTNRARYPHIHAGDNWARFRNAANSGNTVLVNNNIANVNSINAVMTDVQNSTTISTAVRTDLVTALTALRNY
ncbi:MAG: hypothetical protein FWE14_04265 [Lachnospiraceae bacterium]|nr:hypothetical protein [Lachnospiraceae bacterium]